MGSDCISPWSLLTFFFFFYSPYVVDKPWFTLSIAHLQADKLYVFRTLEARAKTCAQ